MARDHYIIKQGYLHTWMLETKTWQPQFYVLHGASEKNAPRLDWYDNQELFMKNPGTRKALFVEEIKSIQDLTSGPEEKKIYGSSAKHLFVVETYRQKHGRYTFNCHTEELLMEWHDLLKNLLKDVLAIGKQMRTMVLEKSMTDDIYNPQLSAASSFDVEVDDTAAAIHCELQGSYKLFLSQRHITLIDPDTCNPVVTWAYRHIRRFGYSEKSLTIEGGSKCGIGTGLFIFKTDQGKHLMDVINDRMNCMKMCKDETPAESEYSYIAFQGVVAPELRPDSPQSSVKDLAPPVDQPPPPPGKQSPLAAKSRTPDLPKRPNSMSNPNTLEKPKPPLKAVKPLTATVGESKSNNESQTNQPKMSEVMLHLSKQAFDAKPTEDELYGYNHLDLKSAAPKVAPQNADENPYGEQLIEKLKLRDVENIPESDYAEIVGDNNNKTE